jgi:predicted benzoate:H+ symporter BenE
MQDQPAGEAPSQPSGRWSPGQAALVAAAVLLAVVVGATVLGQAGVLPESMAAALAALFLALCGLMAGLIGADHRRKERWPGAATAYRVAMWCFFLAALHAVKFHVAVEREAEEERVRQKLEFQRR